MRLDDLDGCQEEVDLALRIALFDSWESLSKAADTILNRGGIKIRFNTRLRSCMGRALLRTNTVEVSSFLWPRATNAEKQNTIRHEVAHLLAFQMRQDRGHGKFWRSVAISVGCNAQRCHNVPTGRSNGMKALCMCGELSISDTMARRMHAGEKYKCRECGIEAILLYK